MICADLSFLGLELDLQKNQIRPRKTTEIQSASSRVKILVIPTNEELEIAKQAYEVVD